MADYKSFDDYFHYSLDKRFGERNPEPPEQIDVGGAVGRVAIKSEEEAKDQFGTIVKSGYATAKGAVQGELGILGEIEHLWNGLASVYNTPEGKSKVDSFLEGLSKESKLPDTERMKEMLNKVVPAADKEYQIAEGIGEVVAPGALLTGMAAKGAKLLKSAKNVLPSASKVTTQPIEPKPIEPKPIEPKPIEPKPIEPKPLVEQKNKPIWAKETLSINQMKRLVPEGTSENLYRQMSNSLLSDLLLSGRNAAANSNTRMVDDLYFATSKEYALGQGANAKGPVVTFKSFDTLVPRQKVAAHDFIKEQAGIPPEVVIEDAKDLRQVRDRIVSIEFPKGSDNVKNIRDGKSAYSIINRLQSEQWKKTIVDDGKIVLTPPVKTLGGKEKANK